MRINNKYLSEISSFSQSIAKQSSQITLGYFNKIFQDGIRSSIKEDNTPVTIADYECENFLLKKIKSKYPEHSIYSEENGVVENGSEIKWIIDPIDGTKNFIRGYPYWGTLIAVEFCGDVVIGIISMPAINKFIFARKGKGCFINGKKVSVSDVDNVSGAYCLYAALDYILEQEYKNNFLSLISSCSYNRGFGDCHGHSFIFNGNAEIMIDPSVAPYDIAASKICIEEAGGKFSDIYGNDTIYGKSAVITNGLVHDKVLKILNAQ